MSETLCGRGHPKIEGEPCPRCVADAASERAIVAARGRRQRRAERRSIEDTPPPEPRRYPASM